jgi:MFS family permease
VRIAAPSEAESPGSALPPVSTGPDPVRRSLPRTVESLQVRNFRVFLCGLLLAGTGVRAQRMAQDWLVLTMTGSPAAVGITTACQFLPILFLGLHGGVLADRFPRRRLLQVTQACMTGVSVVTASLVLTGRVEVWHIYLLALALGVATAVDDPGRDSFITELVGVAHLRNAISLVSSTFQVGAMAGPVVGGVLMGTAGIGYAFLANAVGHAALVVALGLVSPGQLHLGRARTRRGTGIREGLRHAVTTSTVLWPTLMVGLFGFFMISLPVTLTAFARFELDSGPAGAGMLTSVVAVGALVGTTVTARRRRPVRLRTIVGAAGLLAVALLVASAAPNQVLLVALLLPVGAANLAFLTSAQSLVQLTTPEEIRGRIAGVYALVWVGSGALGAPVVGLLAEHLGPRAALVISGTLPAVATILVARHLGRLADVRLGLTSVSVRVAVPTLVHRRR